MRSVRPRSIRIIRVFTSIAEGSHAAGLRKTPSARTQPARDGHTLSDGLPSKLPEALAASHLFSPRVPALVS